MFEDRVTPDEVWDCIEHFPRHSATTSARFADPETVLSEEEQEIPLTHYSPEVEAANDVYDAVISLTAFVSAALSRKRVKLKPHRRPGEARRAAAKAALREQARQEWNELLRQWGIPEV